MINPKHPFYSANDYYREKFGSKIIKIAIDGGFTCPNRDGKLSTKGCIFCSAKGSGDFAGSRVLSVTEQFEQMKEKMAKWYAQGLWTAGMVRSAVKKGILSARDYEEITGESYAADK